MTACCHCPAVRWRLCPCMGRRRREKDRQSEGVTIWQWIWGMGRMIQPQVWLIQGSLSTWPSSKHLWVFIVWQERWRRTGSKNKLAFFNLFIFKGHLLTVASGLIKPFYVFNLAIFWWSPSWVHLHFFLCLYPLLLSLCLSGFVVSGLLLE